MQILYFQNPNTSTWAKKPSQTCWYVMQPCSQTLWPLPRSTIQPLYKVPNNLAAQPEEFPNHHIFNKEKLNNSQPSLTPPPFHPPTAPLHQTSPPFSPSLPTPVCYPRFLTFSFSIFSQLPKFKHCRRSRATHHHSHPCYNAH